MIDVTPYVPLARQIARLVHRRILGRAELDELTSEAMVGLVVARDSYREGRGASFKTWVGFKVQRHLFDWLRTHDRAMSRGDLARVKRGLMEPRRVLPLAAADSRRPDRADGRVAVEDRDHVRALLARLDPRSARLLELYYFAGLTLRKAGAEIGVSESRASQLRSAILDDLRERVGAAPQSARA